jgi:energy-coupling factor transporter ATP-binding protein EcfA2
LGADGSPLLELRGLVAGYDEVDVLRGVSLAVRTGEMVCIIGANGAGKSTLLRTVFGMVAARAGAIRFDRAASLKTTPFLGLDADYGLSKNVSIGTTVEVARPNTRPEDFVTVQTYGVTATGDTTLFLETGQPVSLIAGSLIATARMPAGRLTPFLIAGGGYYGMFLDPQINRGTRRMSGWTATGGGGVRVALTERAGLQFDARDVIFTRYKHARLDPSDGRNPNIFFIEDFPTPPRPKSTVHNIMFSVGFRYVPGLRTEAEPEREPGTQ